MHFTKSLLVVAALGASNVAGRATHRHRHAELHEEKRAVGDTVTAVIDGQTVTWTNEYDGSNEGSTGDSTADSNELRSAGAGVYKASRPKTTAAAAASTYAAAKPSTTSSAAASYNTGSSSSDSAKSYTPFCAASSKSKRATLEQITYKGNTGSTWGCNIKLIDASIADKYDYTVKVTGQNTVPWTYWCWNKMGPSGLMDGWYGHKAVSFTLQPGGLQYIAFDKNTQASCSAWPADSALPTDQYGGWLGTWFEVDFCNESNNGWSGADVSSIQAEAGNSKVYGMQGIYNGQKSTIGENLSVVSNAFDNAKKYEDGHGFNIPAGKASLECVIDYKGN